MSNIKKTKTRNQGSVERGPLVLEQVVLVVQPLRLMSGGGGLQVDALVRGVLHASMDGERGTGNGRSTCGTGGAKRVHMYTVAARLRRRHVLRMRQDMFTETSEL